MCVCDRLVYLLSACYAYIWRSDDNFQELVLSFYLVDSGNQTQAIRLGGKGLYALTHLTNLTMFSLHTYFERIEL